MRDLVAGMRYLGRGQRWVLGHGRWFGFGLLPALVTLALYAVVLTVLGFWTDDIVTWATPFADDWSSAWRGTLRGVFAALLWGGVLMLAVVTFAAVTLLVGEPFYEKLSEKVEESEGGLPPGRDLPLWQELWTALRDSLFVLWRTLLFTVPLFLLGFVPFVGQTIIPVLGFCVSGFFLSLELSSVAMQRRGIPVRERLRMLRRRKALALGFGVPLVLCFLVPVAAVFLMPGAVAGAALLVRDLLGERGPDPQAPGQGGPAQGQAAPQPYGQAPGADGRTASPYGPPPAGPYGAPSGGPYGPPPGDPYGAPPASGGGASTRP
ncbi:MULTISPECIES: EI24 domain-containing protein [unclassified Streptomyces]|uniref:EI24 domain-containing protein n=1 Tax=unclassified Streptomyces TaxID=2593676 RepID=UPI002DDB7689|nr:EI24 domain-containing protein [Streptomyces sp. NBC_01775]WSB80044.1 EI24 domain-containing protein [Streptomyces sp. NBC_01775]WSS40461.1 EI24 domain-containing protein [Streptomyces sp. NBC_01187]